MLASFYRTPYFDTLPKLRLLWLWHNLKSFIKLRAGPRLGHTREWRNRAMESAREANASLVRNFPRFTLKGSSSVLVDPNVSLLTGKLLDKKAFFNLSLIQYFFPLFIRVR